MHNLRRTGRDAPGEVGSEAAVLSDWWLNGVRTSLSTLSKQRVDEPAAADDLGLMWLDVPGSTAIISADLNPGEPTTVKPGSYFRLYIN
jgi:hypothetical protein